MPFDPKLYNERYRIDTTRANWWEYYEGIYFVTINAKQYYFGKITCDPKTKINQMHLSELGKFVDSEIPKIMEHYPYTFVPSWVVMPNHIHFIIMIDVRGRDENANDENANDENANCDVNADRRAPKLMSKIAPKTGSLGLIIGHFKGAVTHYAKEHNIPFQWQSRYWDRILKDQAGFDAVNRYIQNNVRNWHKNS